MKVLTFINIIIYSNLQVKAPSPNSTANHETIQDLIGRFDAASFDNLSPPVDYPNKWAEKSPLQAAVNNRNKINSDKLALSKSQPDLTSVGVGKPDFTGDKINIFSICIWFYKMLYNILIDYLAQIKLIYFFAGFRRGVSAPRPPTKGREENESKNEESWSSGEMVEILIKENSALKHELENCYQRVEKSHRVYLFI